MKKIYLILFLSISANIYVFGAGTKEYASIEEYKGKNYCAGVMAGAYAVYYAINDELVLNSINFNEIFALAIEENKFNFIGLIGPFNIDEILARGFIQKGDKFTLLADFPNILAEYIGPIREVKDIFIEQKICWGVGYSIFEGEIFITELIEYGSFIFE